jgi:hypothetical protein
MLSFIIIYSLIGLQGLFILYLSWKQTLIIQAIFDMVSNQVKKDTKELKEVDFKLYIADLTDTIQTTHNPVNKQLCKSLIAQLKAELTKFK